jgi:hypothetical protein
LRAQANSHAGDLHRRAPYQGSGQPNLVPCRRPRERAERLALSPLFPQQQTFLSPAVTSEKCHNSGHRAASHDHFVGAGKQRGRHGNAELLGGLEVDHQIVLGGRLNWLSTKKPVERSAPIYPASLLEHSAGLMTSDLLRPERESVA